MITGLKVHTENGLLALNDTSENSSTSELLADVVSVARKDNPQNWAFREGSAFGRVLEPDLTLKQNHISNNQVLYLVAAKAPIDQEINLEIAAPDGQTLHFEVRSSTLVSLLLAKVPEHFGLHGVDGKGKPVKWMLVREKTGKQLDSEKTLGEDGVSRHDRLLLEQEVAVQDLAVEGVSPDGQVWSRELPPHTPVLELRDELLTRFEMPKTNYAGDLIEWHLRDEKKQHRLSLEKTLADSGVQSGDRLLLDAPVGACLVVTAGAADTQRRRFAIAGDTPTVEFVQTLVGSLGLGERANDGRPHLWVLTGTNSKKLAPEKTLAANGVTTGDSLSLLLVEPNLRLEMSAPSGAIYTAEKPGAFLLGELLRESVRTLGLKPKNESGHNQEWTIRRKGTSVPLDPNKSLATNGLVDGDRVELTPVSRHVEIETVLVKDSRKMELYWKRLAESKWIWPLALLILAAIGFGIWRKHRGPLTVEVSPRSKTLSAGEREEFYARSAKGEELRAHWSVTLGNVTQRGVYTAPPDLSTKQTATLTATRDDDSSVSASATLQLLPKPPVTTALVIPDTNPPDKQTQPDIPVQPPVEPHNPAQNAMAGSGQPRVKVQPVVVAPISLINIENRQYVFQGSVRNARNTALTWSITPPQLGSITQGGVYTAPADIGSAQTVEIMATSVADPTKSSHFNLSLTPNIKNPLVKVVINSHSSVLNAGQREQFAATVTGSMNTSVTWSSSGLGNILPGGVFTAPTSIPAAGATVRIFATSNADRKQVASTEVALRPSAVPAGPKSGMVNWQGKAGRNQTLTIGNGNPGTIGAFPGVPIEVMIPDRNVQVVSPPSAANGWKSVVVQTHHNEQTIQVNWNVLEGRGNEKR